jgi:hypothetical protein
MITDRLGFDVLTLSDPNIAGLFKVARFTCTECGDHIDVTIKGIISPDFMARKANQKGWRVDADKKNVARCPKCLSANRKESKVTVMPLKPEVAQPTADQRVKIRNYLDKHFDDSVGIYLDDMSDHKIAEIVNVPRAVVERIRELAYGPIKVDPEIVAIRAEVASLARQIGDHEKALDESKGRLKSLEDRLAKMVQKRAA